MKRYQCLGFAFAAAFVVATSIINRAEGIAPGTNSMALKRLVADALEQNPELKFYEAELAAAKAGRRSAGLLPNPELSGSVGHKSSRELATGIGAELVLIEVHHQVNPGSRQNTLQGGYSFALDVLERFNERS